ncbi:MAG: hypothetical protein UU01_C0005G0012 [Parcubacteria group bacterium GW2011_GWA2_40_37]|nr:MAG: hypothetical protein UU01_C0005G0012 [Parcubacteria group bacterium GW2011_GWA2_40_37]
MVSVVYWFARTPVEGEERVQIPSDTPIFFFPTRV